MNAPLMCANIVPKGTKTGVWKKKDGAISDPLSKSAAHKEENYDGNKENIGLIPEIMTDRIGICESQSSLSDVKKKYSLLLPLVIDYGTQSIVAFGGWTARRRFQSLVSLRNCSCRISASCLVYARR